MGPLFYDEVEGDNGLDPRGLCGGNFRDGESKKQEIERVQTLLLGSMDRNALTGRSFYQFQCYVNLALGLMHNLMMKLWLCW